MPFSRVTTECFAICISLPHVLYLIIFHHKAHVVILQDDMYDSTKKRHEICQPIIIVQRTERHRLDKGFSRKLKGEIISISVCTEQ
jgi:hypothetical protein